MTRLTNILSGRGWHDLVLFIVSAGLYSPSLMNGFVGDDYIYFIGNRYISSFDLKTILLHGAIGSDYCPLRDLSFALDYLVWGENPFGFHLMNLLLFGITAVAVKHLFIRLSELLADGLEQPEETDSYVIVPFLAALLFALHPIHREVVYAVYNRGALLTALFSVLSCLAFISFLRGDRFRTRHYAAAFFLCVCAFMSREYGIILPLVLLLLAAFHQPSRNLYRFLATIPFFMAAALFYLIFRQFAIDASYIMPSPAPFLHGALSKLAIAFKIIVYYPVKMIGVELPVSSFFGPDPDLIALIAAVVTVAALTVVYMARRRHPRLLFSLLLYLVCLLPVLNFFKTYPIVADRYVYLPGLWLFFAVTAFPFRGWKRYVLLTCVVVVSIWSITTVRYMWFWRNDVVYWGRLVSIYRMPTLYARLGAAHFRERNHVAAREAFSLARSFATSVTDKLLIGDTCVRIGYREGAILAYEDAISKAGESGAALFPVGFHVSLANAYYGEGDFRRAIIHYEQAMKLKPGIAGGDFYSNLATAYYNTGDLRNALRYFELAIEQNPRVAALHNNVGALRAESGDYAAAIKSLELATTLDPGYGQAFLNLARTYRDMGDVENGNRYAGVLRSRFPHLLRELEQVK